MKLLNRPLHRPVGIVLTAALLLLGFDLATYAANGDSLLIGKTNKATKATKVQRTSTGPVLDLKAKPGSPPLKVNSTGKVAKLNADQVDGLSAAALQTTATTYDLSHPSDHPTPSWQLPLAQGLYLVNWQAYIDSDTQPVHILCSVVYGGDHIAAQEVVNTGPASGMSGSGTLQVSAITPQFSCTATGGDIVGFTSGQGIQVTVQKLTANPVTPVARVQP